jgi:hypothetical protein
MNLNLLGDVEDMWPTRRGWILVFLIILLVLILLCRPSNINGLSISPTADTIMMIVLMTLISTFIGGWDMFWTREPFVNLTIRTKPKKVMPDGQHDSGMRYPQNHFRLAIENMKDVPVTICKGKILFRHKYKCVKPVVYEFTKDTPIEGIMPYGSKWEEDCSAGYNLTEFESFTVRLLYKTDNGYRYRSSRKCYVKNWNGPSLESLCEYSHSDIDSKYEILVRQMDSATQHEKFPKKKRKGGL